MVSLCIAVALSAAPQDCRVAYEQVRYKDAIAACTEAISTSPREQLAELYRLLALSLASQGEHERAKAAFVSLLAVDPAATLSESYSPKLRADFEAARHAGAGVPVTLGLEPPRAQAGQPLGVHVTIQDGAAKPVRAVRVQSDGADVTLPREGPLDATLPQSAEAGARAVTLSARDSFGGLLSERHLSVEIQEAPRKSAALSWRLWGSLAVVGGVAGGALGLTSRFEGQAARTAMYGDTQFALQQRANALAIAADACFAVAGALAVVTLVVLLAAR
jgi:tetratricopeptide (TPR) repeat protein